LVRPDFMHDRAGREIDLRAASPGKLKRAFLRDVRQRQADVAVTEKLDEWELHSSGLTPHGLDSEAVRRIIQATGKAVLQPAERRALRQAFAGGLNCLRPLRRRGAIEDDTCPWCGQQDTIPHRIWSQCGPPELQQLREDLNLLKDYAAGEGIEQLRLVNPVLFPAVAPPPRNLGWNTGQSSTASRPPLTSSGWFVRFAMASRCSWTGVALPLTRATLARPAR